MEGFERMTVRLQLVAKRAIIDGELAFFQLKGRLKFPFMQHVLRYPCHELILGQLPGFAIHLTQTDQTNEALLEGIVVADDDQLIEAAHAANLFSKVHTPQYIHILGWLIKE